MPFTASAAVDHLRRADPKLRLVIDAVGPFDLRPQRNRFRMLVRSIIAQQLSAAAARTINSRVAALLADSFTPEAFAGISTRRLQACGVSRQKLAYLRDLTRAVESGSIPLARLGRLDDEAIIERLVTVKGIGRWTAQMFLIFALGRPDVLPEDDLGVRAAVRRLHGLAEIPSKPLFRELTASWRPYATAASWYCWRSADLGFFRAKAGD